MCEELVKRLRDKARLEREYNSTGALEDEAADAIEGFAHAVAQMTEWRKNPWIPVTEQPPFKVGDEGYNGYLVYVNGCYEIADYTTDKDDNVPYFHVDGEYEPDVAHYMPLPEPPVVGDGSSISFQEE